MAQFTVFYECSNCGEEQGLVVPMASALGMASELSTPCQLCGAGKLRMTEAQQLAFQAAETQDLDESMRLARRALSLNPKCETALQAAAGTAYQLGDLQALDEYSRLLVSLYPGNPLTHYYRGNYFAVIDEHSSAGRHYDRCLELDPSDFRAAANKATCLVRSGSAAEGLRFLDTYKRTLDQFSSIEEDPEYYALDIGHIVCANVAGERGRASQLLQEALARYRGIPQVCGMLEQIQREEGL